MYIYIEAVCIEFLYCKMRNNEHYVEEFCFLFLFICFPLGEGGGLVLNCRIFLLLNEGEKGWVCASSSKMPEWPQINELLSVCVYF